MNALKRLSEAEGEGSRKKQKLDRKEFLPRSYQVAVFEVALRRNTIVVLDTGAGKAMITLMLIRAMGKNLKARGDNHLVMQVLVMTPQKLLDALRKAFLTMDLVQLMIFDECHRATGNHPYARIMKEFYHMTLLKPHIFGMTASPVIRKV